MPHGLIKPRRITNIGTTIPTIRPGDLRAWLNGMDGMVTDSVDPAAPNWATAYTGIKRLWAAFKDTEKSLIQATSVTMEAGQAVGADAMEIRQRLCGQR